MGCRKVEKQTKQDTDAPKKNPREPPRPEMRPEKSRKGLQGGPKAPEAPQRPTKAEKYEKPIVKLMFLRKNIKFLKSNKGFAHKNASRRPPPRECQKSASGF